MPQLTADAPYRLLQISDCHLAADSAAPYRKRNAAQGLEQIVALSQAWRPQQLLLSGDLSEDASTESYQRLKSLLSPIDAPVCTIPGNHDEPATQQQFFACGPWQGPLAVNAGNWCLLLLNSAVPRRVDGAISEADLAALDDLLRARPEPHALLALHHQPVPVGSPWIDPHRLQSPEPLLQWVAAQPRVRGVVWGHIHQAFESTLGHARLLGCPSTAANTRPGTQRFEDDGHGPAARWLELQADGGLRTGVLTAVGGLPHAGS